MLKKTIFALILAIQFVAVAGQGLASLPEPGCYPCPEVSSQVAAR